MLDVNIIFNVLACHLKSGEAYDSELKRIKQLKEIFQLSIQCKNSIIAMDSNNSKEYELDYDSSNENISEVIKNHGYVDIFNNINGFECFKMRHNGGNQPKKFFQFMFDRIDKIVVKSDCTSFEACLDTYGFQRYNLANYDKLHLLRISPQLRENLKEYCEKRIAFVVNNNINNSISLSTSTSTSVDNNGKNESTCINNRTSDSKEIFSDSLFEELMDLYPNIHAPSDHPPISAIVKII